MNICFTYLGKEYLNFNTDSEEWKNLNIPDEDKLSIICKCKLESAYKQRQLAYKEESDPLYIEWQYDKTPEKEQIWRDKVVEIKNHIPLPE